MNVVIETMPDFLRQRITTYYVTHGLGRAAMSTADADAICTRVNTTTAASGDSTSEQAVQAELDAMASADVQALYRLTIEASTVEIDD